MYLFCAKGLELTFNSAKNDSGNITTRLRLSYCRSPCCQRGDKNLNTRNVLSIAAVVDEAHCIEKCFHSSTYDPPFLFDTRMDVVY